MLRLPKTRANQGGSRYVEERCRESHFHVPSKKDCTAKGARAGREWGRDGERPGRPRTRSRHQTKDRSRSEDERKGAAEDVLQPRTAGARRFRVAHERTDAPRIGGRGLPQRASPDSVAASKRNVFRQRVEYNRRFTAQESEAGRKWERSSTNNSYGIYRY